MKLYETIKKVIFRLVPKLFFIKNEAFVRSCVSLFYRGNKQFCNLCKTSLRTFVQNENKSCPKCGSIARERRLWQLLESKLLNDKKYILDFSPSRASYRKLKKRFGTRYTGTDLSGDFLADKNYDITQMDCPNEHFDLIICYHILEHIPNDRKAFRELHRILTKDGICVIQTPFKDGETYEDESIQSPEDRLKHFGQEDHVRIYSLKGLEERLNQAGFSCDILRFEENTAEEIRLGFKEKEYILICSKK